MSEMQKTLERLGGGEVHDYKHALIDHECLNNAPATINFVGACTTIHRSTMNAQIMLLPL